MKFIDVQHQKKLNTNASLYKTKKKYVAYAFSQTSDIFFNQMQS